MSFLFPAKLSCEEVSSKNYEVVMDPARGGLWLAAKLVTACCLARSFFEML